MFFLSGRVLRGEKIIFFMEKFRGNFMAQCAKDKSVRGGLTRVRRTAYNETRTKLGGMK